MSAETDLLNEAATQLRATRYVGGCMCEDSDYWFDRSVCPEPCGSMHDVCNDCGHIVGRCMSLELAAKPSALDLALADLLDAIAVDRVMDPYLGKPYDEPALAVANAYLSGRAAS